MVALRDCQLAWMDPSQVLGAYVSFGKVEQLLSVLPSTGVEQT